MQAIHDDQEIRRFEDELSSPRNTLRACLLLLLEERPGHGYDLLTRLEPLGLARKNPGRVYRALQWLERAGFAQPSWDATGRGPARRVYELSARGRTALDVSSSLLRRQAKSLDDRLARYMLSRLRVLASNKEVFELSVKTQLLVLAIDETSARRKLERVFGQPHVLDTDVRTTGAVSIRPRRRER